MKVFNVGRSFSLFIWKAAPKPKKCKHSCPNVSVYTPEQPPADAKAASTAAAIPATAKDAAKAATWALLG